MHPHSEGHRVIVGRPFRVPAGEHMVGARFLNATAGDSVIVTRTTSSIREKLNQRRDLQVTTDFRDVYAELLGEHLGNKAAGKVLMGHKPRRVGLLSGLRAHK